MTQGSFSNPNKKYQVFFYFSIGITIFLELNIEYGIRRL